MQYSARGRLLALTAAVKAPAGRREYDRIVSNAQAAMLPTIYAYRAKSIMSTDA
jgi:hypothetical protein